MSITIISLATVALWLWAQNSYFKSSFRYILGESTGKITYASLYNSFFIHPYSVPFVQDTTHTRRLA